jgi:hypothetical protein
VIQKLNQDEPGQLGKLLRRMAQAGLNVLMQYSDHNHQLVLVVGNLQAARLGCLEPAALRVRREYLDLLVPVLK